MRFSRHAKNGMRRYRVAAADVASVVQPSNRIAPGASGNPRYRGVVDGRRFTVVIALDNPEFIITIFGGEEI